MKRLGIIVMTLVLMVVSVSCGGSSPTEDVEKYISVNQDMLKSAIKEIEQGDGASLESAFGLDEEMMSVFSESDKELLKELMKKVSDFEYEIKDEKIDGDKATVTVTFTAYNFGEKMSLAIPTLIQEAMAYAATGADEEAITKKLYGSLFQKLLEAEKTYKADMTFDLEKADGSWKVSVDDEELANIIWGNMLKVGEQFSQF